MGVATVLIGAMPTAAQIGAAAPVLLIILRVLQGIAQGGEWAGAVVFSAKHAPRGRRGLWGVSASIGGSSGITLANATFLATGLGMSDTAFLSWGWRVPFLASIVLIGVGLWVRLRVDETPVFNDELAGGGVSPAPLRDVSRKQPLELTLGTGAAIVVFRPCPDRIVVSAPSPASGCRRCCALGPGIQRAEWPGSSRVSRTTTESLIWASSSSFSTRFFSAVRALTRSVR